MFKHKFLTYIVPSTTSDVSRTVQNKVRLLNILSSLILDLQCMMSSIILEVVIRAALKLLFSLEESFSKLLNSNSEHSRLTSTYTIHSN